MARQIIRSIRKGSAQWNEEDRLALGTMLLKCGYNVKITHRPIQDSKKNQNEYVVEFWEE